MPTNTAPQTNWTVIPRGITNGNLAFAVFVSPNQQVDTSTFDASFWSTWLTIGVPSIVSGGGTLTITAPNHSEQTVPFKLPTPPGDATENSNAWAALLAYVPPAQNGAAVVSMNAPPTASSSPISADAHDLIAMTSPLHDLLPQIGMLNTAFVYRAMTAGRTTSGLQQISEFAQGVIEETMSDLTFLNPRDARRGLPLGRNASDFKKYLLGLLATGDPKDARKARLAERNLYRLADDPYATLKDEVFGSLLELLNPLRQPGQAGAHEDPLTTFVELAVFHKRCQPKKLGATLAPSAQQRTTAPTTIPNLFRALSSLGSMPEWLSRLGFSYEIDSLLLPPGLSDGSILTAASRLSNAASVPVTITSHGYPAFIPPPQPIPPPAQSAPVFHFSKGYLVLDGCDLVTSDLDGEGLRTIQYANSLRPAVPPTPSPSGDGDLPDPPITDNTTGASGPPSRSIGISLVQTATASHLKERLRRYQDELNQATTPPLGLSDLIRGYTPEVSTDGKHWASLTQRRVAYKVTSTEVDCTAFSEQDFILENDAPVELGAMSHSDQASAGNSNTSGVQNLHIASTLFHWEGWGLSIPSPFPVAPQGYQPQPPTAPFPIATCYQPLSKEKGGFTRLRFGATYFFRVCPLDLVSHRMGSVDSGAPSTSTTQLSIPYLRYDPVPAPVLLLEGTLDPSKYPGETLNCIVVRDNDPDYQSTRCLVPPVAGFNLLVQHGVLDSDALITENGFKTFDEIRSFEDVLIEPDGSFPTTNIVSMVDGKQTMYNVPIYAEGKHQPSCAYLPDPMAKSVIPQFIDLSDPTNTVIDSFDSTPFESRTFYVDDGNGPRQWPYAKRLRLLVQTFALGLPKSPQAEWQWDSQNKTWILNVTIPKAWQVKLLIPCIPDDSSASRLFAAPAFTEEYQKGLLEKFRSRADLLSTELLPTRSDVAKALARGALPNVTPPLELVIVSAIRKPLAESHIEASSITIAPRTYDSSIVQLSLTVDIGDRRSTGKLEIIADWADATDDGSSATGLSKPATSTSHVAQYCLNLQNSRMKQPFTNVAQTFPDTRWRSVSLSANSVSRFMHYYRDDTSETDFITTDSQPQTITVLSTSRPLPLSVVKIIPLLSVHSRQVSPDTLLYKRIGGAFRIYVDRPWDSSGPDERLAVVLWGEDFENSQPPCYDSANKFVPKAYRSWYADPQLEPYVTRWGADPAWLQDTERPEDPVWDASVTHLAPFSRAFKIPPIKEDEPLRNADIRKCAFPAEIPLGAADTQPATIDPTRQPYFTLATYGVKWDSVQRLWYSDILIEDAPPCFIRLALMRYQPQSLINRECSPVVIAPFALMGHERTVYLQQQTGGTLELQIFGVPRFVNSTRKRSRFNVELQYNDGAGWTPASQDQQPKPNPLSVPPISEDNLYAMLVSYSMAVTTPYSNKRVIIREFQSWFADDPARRSIRTEQDQLLGPPIMLRLPELN